MKLNSITRNIDQNNFDQLRLLAASLVILSHSYPLASGNAIKEPFVSLSGWSLGFLSVLIFFIISGYLITQSWNNRPKLIIFAWKRILRIYPGLIFSILFATILIGLLVSSLNIAEYLSNLNILNIIKDIIFLSQDHIPSVFENNIFPAEVNGSLWTLKIEVVMYLVTALFGLSGILMKKWPVIIFLFSLIAIGNSNYLFGYIQNIPMALHYINYAIYYLIGMCYFLYKDKIRFNYVLFLFLFAFWVLSFQSFSYILPYASIIVPYIPYISIPYIIIFCAFAPTKYLHKLTGKGDYSYGLYIYAFPIQQTIVHFSKNTITPLELFILAYPLTFFISYLSWNYIEKQALKFKNILNDRFEDGLELAPASSNKRKTW